MRHQLEYLVVKSVELAVRPLPMRTVRKLGERLGLTFYLVDRVHRRIAIANLEAAFPNRTADDREAIAKAMFKHFGRLLLELLKFSALSNDEKLAMVDWEGEERVEEESDPQRCKRVADREEESVVGCLQGGGEPHEADRHQERPKPALRPAPPRDQPACNERPANREDESRLLGMTHSAEFVVIARLR